MEWSNFEVKAFFKLLFNPQGPQLNCIFLPEISWFAWVSLLVCVVLFDIESRYEEMPQFCFAVGQYKRGQPSPMNGCKIGHSV